MGWGSRAPPPRNPIVTGFDFAPTDANLTAQNGSFRSDLTTATDIFRNSGFYTVSAIFGGGDKTGLDPGNHIAPDDPLPVTVGGSFTIGFNTGTGSFNENLTVTSVQRGATSLAIAASGTITETRGFSRPALDDAPVYYSAAYTQDGDGTITGSFSDSTTPPAGSDVPEPASIALLGAALAGLGAAPRRFRKH